MQLTYILLTLKIYLKQVTTKTKGKKNQNNTQEDRNFNIYNCAGKMSCLFYSAHMFSLSPISLYTTIHTLSYGIFALYQQELCNLH